MTTFSSLGLIEPLQRAVAAQNYKRPTPIQVQAIPPLLEGRDVLGCAQTGTGKTAAFALPILQHLSEEVPNRGRRQIRALILSPTRELAAQIDDAFEGYSAFLKLRRVCIFGGVNQKRQVDRLQRGVDILVATPGRLLDLIGQGYVDHGHVEFFVLDEADRMLDMGFIRDIRRVLALLPDERQNLLFSATMPPEIAKLAGAFLDAPVTVEVTPESMTVERISQQVMFVSKADKKRLLAELIEEKNVDRAIVFTRTKHGANRLVKQLDRAGINAAAIHGNKSQNARTRALEGFKDGKIPILVATDIASRGIDVDDVSHVFNYDLPNEPETYVHRIGRTARAGREGVAISFCDESEGKYLRDIERLIEQPIDRDLEHDFHCEEAVLDPPRRGAQRRGTVEVRRTPNRSDSKRPPRQRSDRGRGRADRGEVNDSSTPAEKPAARDASAGEGGRTSGRRPQRRRSAAPGAAPQTSEGEAASTEAPRSRRRRRGRGRGRGRGQSSKTQSDETRSESPRSDKPSPAKESSESAHRRARPQRQETASEESTERPRRRRRTSKSAEAAPESTEGGQERQRRRPFRYKATTRTPE